MKNQTSTSHIKNVECTGKVRQYLYLTNPITGTTIKLNKLNNFYSKRRYFPLEEKKNSYK